MYICLILKETQIFDSSEISCSRQTAVDLRLRGYRSEGAGNGKESESTQKKMHFYTHVNIKYMFIYYVIILAPSLKCSSLQ